MLSTTWFIVGFIFSIFSYSSLFAYFQREYPLLKEEDYYSDMRWSIFVATLVFICPPAVLGIPLGLLDNPFKHGLKFY